MALGRTVGGIDRSVCRAERENPLVPHTLPREFFEIGSCPRLSQIKQKEKKDEGRGAKRTLVLHAPPFTCRIVNQRVARRRFGSGAAYINSPGSTSCFQPLRRRCAPRNDIPYLKGIGFRSCSGFGSGQPTSAAPRRSGTRWRSHRRPCRHKAPSPTNAGWMRKRWCSRPQNRR